MQRKDVMYTRYSSDMQRNESCEDQERNVRLGLTRKAIDPANFEVLNDRAASGTKNDRVVFEQLLARIRRGEIRILAVDDQSRFSRADNAFSFIKDLVYSGGRFISTGEGIDTDEEGESDHDNRLTMDRDNRWYVHDWTSSANTGGLSSVASGVVASARVFSRHDHRGCRHQRLIHGISRPSRWQRSIAA